MQRQFPPLKPRSVLGVAAHPDDLDFGAGGTLAKFAAEGAEVHILILTDGSKGSADPAMTGHKLARIRQQEQQGALEVMGGATVDFLGYPDAHLEVTMQLKRDIVQAVRRYKPDVVITMDPTMVYSAERGFVNHPDHRAAGQAALDAVFPLARDHMTFPELVAAGYEPHKTPTLLLINFNTVNYYSDITDYLDTKLQLMARHESQGFAAPEVQDRARSFAETAGKKAGCRYAEAFVRLDIA